MQHIQHLSLTWTRPRDSETEKGGGQPAGPLPMPDRARIRHVAKMYHAQLRDAERSGGSTTAVLREQADALREFSLELSPEVASEFLNIFTEESSALEREWLAHRRTYKSPLELPPMLMTTL